MNDLFWKKKYADYAAGFGTFSKLMKDTVPDITHDDIFHHWIHVLEEVCDCEGCREEADGRAGVSAVEGVGWGFELAAAAGDEPVFEATGAGGFGAQADAHGFEGLAHYDCVVGV